MGNSLSERVRQVRAAFPGWAVEALLVTNLANCRWLSGFTGSSATLLITSDRAILATDSRYWEQAVTQAPEFELYQSRRTLQDTAELITSASVSTIGFEASHVTVQQAQELQRIAGVSWQPLNHPLEPMRMVKSEAEISVIQAAAAITDAAMGRLPDLALPGISEVALAWKLESYMRDLGASGLAFSPIIAFGPNSARPHHSPGDRKLQQGDILLVDIGAQIDGYHSDLTRTFYFGKTVDPLFQDIFDIVLAAQTAALDTIKAGMNTQEAHLTAAAVINESGYADNFGHGLGHGLGLEIHEMPFLSPIREPQQLKTDSTITIEPGIYLPTWGGIRIEDLAQITRGGLKLLSHFPKKPFLISP